MKLTHRIYFKVVEQQRQGYPKPDKVILGRKEKEEYWELIREFPFLSSPIFNNPLSSGFKSEIFGLKITWSRRPKYLCVVSKRPRVKGKTKHYVHLDDYLLTTKHKNCDCSSCRPWTT